MKDRLCEGFSDACITTATPKHRQQASEKRQGTKSREVGSGRCSGDYGDLGASTVAGNEARGFALGDRGVSWARRTGNGPSRRSKLRNVLVVERGDWVGGVVGGG